MNGFRGEPLQWKVGLMNAEAKYLTAETFGFKLNASATTMKKKQIWTLEQGDGDDDVVYLRSHLGRYLSGDKKGNVTGDSEERGADERFSIEYNRDNSGRWALRNVSHGYYLGGIGESLRCYEKTAGENEWWTIHLGLHPQVNLRNSSRKTYAHLNTDTQKIQFDELIPWGADALITLEFCNGKYAVKTCDNCYLHRNGSLVAGPSAETLFALEIRTMPSPGMALKDSSGKYLTAIGKDGVMQARKTAQNVGKDDIFTIEDSHPQVFLTALHNGKKVSIKQGVDVSANQDEVTDTETFQVELYRQSADDQWRMRTSQNMLWTLDESSGGIQSTGRDKNARSLFRLEWLQNGEVAIRASNNRYVTSRPNGSLYAVSSDVGVKEKFYFTIINRPLLVLKCEHGFIGAKKAGNSRIECNKIAYDIIYMEHSHGKSSVYNLKGADGMYWSQESDGSIYVNSHEPQPFIFELRGLSRFSIRAPNGCYLKGEQNGIVSAKSASIDQATFWEY